MDKPPPLKPIQRIALTITPKRIGDSIKKESMEWHVICTKCGLHRSVWDLGGIRWKAYSRGKRVFTRCSQCEQRVWAKVERLRETRES